LAGHVGCSLLNDTTSAKTLPREENASKKFCQRPLRMEVYSPPYLFSGIDDNGNPIPALLRRGGWKVNKKRIQRLYREAGLRVPASRERKRRCLTGTSENGCTRRRAEYIDLVCVL
jgi:hypothetical protein